MEDVWRTPGTLPTWARWLIATACGISVLVAAEGLRSLWDYGGFASDMNGYWFRNGLAVAVAVTIVLAWLPGWRMARSLRVAVLLPLIHVAAILVTAKLWNALETDIAHFWCCTEWEPKVALPPATFVLALPVLAVIAVSIKRRHGEWAHAMVMLTLASLLLIGLWLPIATSIWLDGGTIASWDHLHTTMEHPAAFIALAVMPPVVIAIAFTAIAFRRPPLVERQRANIKIGIGMLFAISVLAQLSAPDAGAMLYLNFVHVILIAVFLCVVSLVVFAAATWLGSRLAHRMARRMRTEHGIVSCDERTVGALEITSWLRGPRLATRSFTVTTPRGDVPVSGANVLAHVPASTTRLEIGQHAAILTVGDRVEIAGRSQSAEGHPFRAMDVANISVVTVPGAAPYRFGDVALVVWRPCVAYLAILVAVALPGLVVLVK